MRAYHIVTSHPRKVGSNPRQRDQEYIKEIKPFSRREGGQVLGGNCTSLVGCPFPIKWKTSSPDLHWLLDPGVPGLELFSL